MFGGQGPTAKSSLSGTLERVVFQNTETQWTVGKLVREKNPVPVTIVGSLLGVAIGTPLEVRGEWVVDPKFGKQFRIESYQTRSPETLAGIERYLGSGLVPGVGPELAKRIVAHFGHDTMEVIRQTPSRLIEVEGIGSSRVEKIRAAWGEQAVTQEAMVFLRGHGVNVGLAARILKRYGRDAVGIIRQNPYRLAIDIAGVGFRTADAIAQKLGLSPASPARLEAGLVHILGTSVEDGHVHVPQPELLRSAAALLGVEESLLSSPLKRLVASSVVVKESLGERGLCISLKPIWEHEHEAAQFLTALLSTPMAAIKGDWSLVLATFEQAAGYHLAYQQRCAIEAGSRDKCVVITGGPGVGKTTIIRALAYLLKHSHRRVALAAPTGRAANRLAEAAREPATTLHRLLEYQPRTNDFQRSHENPLEVDTVIVDEVSMLDIALFHHLLKAIPSQAQLILVGDVDQLPSVGPGAVLSDVVESGAVTVIRLTEIFRQAQESNIVINAHRINQGLLPEIDPDADPSSSDFFFVERTDPIAIRDTMVKLVADRIPKRFGFDPIHEVQVLCPMHRGELGTTALNIALQERLTPQGTATQELRRGDRTYRKGDKVMQIRNDYDKAIFNGDIGVVSSIDVEERILLVEFPGGRIARYEREELDDLVLAYAVSVHKSQGSEYSAVVIPLATQHYMMLQRNLLYTAITRGKKLVCLVGAKKAVTMAVRNATTKTRCTWLSQRIASASDL